MSAPYATDDSYYNQAAPGKKTSAAGAQSSMFGILYGGEDASPSSGKGGKRQVASRGRDAAPFATEPEARRAAPSYDAPQTYAMPPPAYDGRGPSYDAPPPFTEEEMGYDPRRHLMDPSYQPQYGAGMDQYSAEEELPYEPQSAAYQDLPYENMPPVRNVPERAAPKYAVHHDAPWAVEQDQASEYSSPRGGATKKAGDTGNKWAVGADKVGQGHTANAAASAYAEASSARARAAARNGSAGLW
jgi:hypothetical protein